MERDIMANISETERNTINDFIKKVDDDIYNKLDKTLLSDLNDPEAQKELYQLASNPIVSKDPNSPEAKNIIASAISDYQNSLYLKNTLNDKTKDLSDAEKAYVSKFVDINPDYALKLADRFHNLKEKGMLVGGIQNAASDVVDILNSIPQLLGAVGGAIGGTVSTGIKMLGEPADQQAADMAKIGSSVAQYGTDLVKTIANTYSQPVEYFKSQPASAILDILSIAAPLAKGLEAFKGADVAEQLSEANKVNPDKVIYTALNANKSPATVAESALDASADSAMKAALDRIDNVKQSGNIDEAEKLQNALTTYGPYAALQNSTLDRLTEAAKAAGKELLGLGETSVNYDNAATNNAIALDLLNYVDQTSNPELRNKLIDISKSIANQDLEGAKNKLLDMLDSINPETDIGIRNKLTNILEPIYQKNGEEAAARIQSFINSIDKQHGDLASMVTDMFKPYYVGVLGDIGDITPEKFQELNNKIQEMKNKNLSSLDIFRNLTPSEQDMLSFPNAIEKAKSNDTIAVSLSSKIPYKDGEREVNALYLAKVPKNSYLIDNAPERLVVGKGNVEKEIPLYRIDRTANLDKLKDDLASRNINIDIKPVSLQESNKAINKGLQTLQSAFKQNVLFTRPAWMVNNAIGNAIFGFIHSPQSLGYLILHPKLSARVGDLIETSTLAAEAMDKAAGAAKISNKNIVIDLVKTLIKPETKTDAATRGISTALYAGLGTALGGPVGAVAGAVGGWTMPAILRNFNDTIEKSFRGAMFLRRYNVLNEEGYKDLVEALKNIKDANGKLFELAKQGKVNLEDAAKAIRAVNDAYFDYSLKFSSSNPLVKYFRDPKVQMAVGTAIPFYKFLLQSVYAAGLLLAKTPNKAEIFRLLDMPIRTKQYVEPVEKIPLVDNNNIENLLQVAAQKTSQLSDLLDSGILLNKQTQYKNIDNTPFYLYVSKVLSPKYASPFQFPTDLINKIAKAKTLLDTTILSALLDPQVYGVSSSPMYQFITILSTGKDSNGNDYSLDYDNKNVYFKDKYGNTKLIADREAFNQLTYYLLKNQKIPQQVEQNFGDSLQYIPSTTKEQPHIRLENALIGAFLPQVMTILATAFPEQMKNSASLGYVLKELFAKLTQSKTELETIQDNLNTNKNLDEQDKEALMDVLNNYKLSGSLVAYLRNQLTSDQKQSDLFDKLLRLFGVPVYTIKNEYPNVSDIFSLTNVSKDIKRKLVDTYIQFLSSPGNSTNNANNQTTKK